MYVCDLSFNAFYVASISIDEITCFKGSSRGLTQEMNKEGINSVFSIVEIALYIRPMDQLPRQKFAKSSIRQRFPNFLASWCPKHFPNHVNSLTA